MVIAVIWPFVTVTVPVALTPPAGGSEKMTFAVA